MKMILRSLLAPLLLLLFLLLLSLPALAVPVPTGYTAASQITLTAPSGGLTTGFTAEVTLTSSTSLTPGTLAAGVKDFTTTLPDGAIAEPTKYPSGYPSDLAVYWYNGSAWVQIDDDVRQANSGAYVVNFKLQAAIAGSGVDSNYLIAYGNVSPTVKASLPAIWQFADDFLTPMTASTSAVPTPPSGFSATYYRNGGTSVAVSGNALVENSGDSIHGLQFAIPGRTSGAANPFDLSVEATYSVNEDNDGFGIYTTPASNSQWFALGVTTSNGSGSTGAISQPGVGYGTQIPPSVFPLVTANVPTQMRLRGSATAATPGQMQARLTVASAAPSAFISQTGTDLTQTSNTELGLGSPSSSTNTVSYRYLRVRQYVPADPSYSVATVTLAAQSVVTVTLTPQTVSLINGATQQFTGSASSGSVTYSVQGGGAGGTVNSSGLYTAPATGTGTDTVVATSVSDGTKTASATITVTAASAPGQPQISVLPTSSGNVVSVTAAVAAGSNAVAGYALYSGSSAGGEGGTALQTITPSSFPASFAADAAAAPGAAKYYVVRAYDTAAVSGPASAEKSVARSALASTGTPYTQTFVAPYGPGATGLSLGYTIYDAAGAVLVPHTTAGVSELPGQGVYSVAPSLSPSWAGYLVWDAPPGSAAYTDTFAAPAPAAAGTAVLSTSDETTLNGLATSVAALTVALANVQAAIISNGAAIAGVPAGTVAAMKTDSVLARTFSRAYQKYTYTISGHTMSLLKDDGTPLLGQDGVTPVTVTITSDTATGTITGKQ